MTMHPIYLLIMAVLAAVCLWFGRGPRDKDDDEWNDTPLSSPAPEDSEPSADEEDDDNPQSSQESPGGA